MTQQPSEQDSSSSSDAMDVSRQTVAYRLLIRGKVQGVCYRQSMILQARAEGVSGWVRNRLDGSVEAVVSGEVDAVERLIGWARRGPRHAAVQSVEIESCAVIYGAFEQRETG